MRRRKRRSARASKARKRAVARKVRHIRDVCSDRRMSKRQYDASIRNAKKHPYARRVIVRAD